MDADLYATLGVDRSASPEEIARAGRRKARETHPDKGGSEEAWHALALAREVLGDDAKRARYDATGEIPQPQRSIEDEARAARDAGFERGRSEGLAAAAAEVAQRMADLDARRRLLDGLARQIVAPLDRFDEETAADLARLAVTVGAQLARRELSVDERSIIAIIRDCVALLPSSAREVRVRVHPRDAAVLRDHVQPGAVPGEWSAIEDVSISRGGCVIEAEASRIDARLEERIAAAMAAVLGEVR